MKRGREHNNKYWKVCVELELSDCSSRCVKLCSYLKNNLKGITNGSEANAHTTPFLQV